MTEPHDGGAHSSGPAAALVEPPQDGDQACSPQAAEGAPAEGGEREAECDPEMAQWLVRTLQKVQPGAELSEGSIMTLTTLLDGITQRILEEAKAISSGGGSAEAEAAAGPSEAGTSGSGGGAGGSSNKPLTSLDIHKALKRVLPGDPSENRLRPYLPAVTKQAWHLDKQSLKGVKKLKTAGAAEALQAAKQAAAATQSGSSGKENSSAAAGVLAEEQQRLAEQQGAAPVSQE